MNDRRHPNPALAARNVRINADRPVGTRTQGVAPPERSASNEIIKQLPENKTYITGFEMILVGADFVGSTDLCNWYTLARIRPPQGREIFLNSIEITQSSPDSAGTVALDALPWGDKLGRGAAIVIGERLPVNEPNDAVSNGRWSAAPFQFPGFNAAQGVDTVPYAPHDPMLIEGDYLFARDWSIGKATDTQPYKWSVPKHYGASGYRIGSDSHLDVCLVLRKDALNRAAPGGGTINDDRTIYGHCVVQLFCMVTSNRGQF